MAIANHFYNETTRRYVALFGTLFNQLKITRSDNAGTEVQSLIVPLAYAPFQKVLARLNQDPDLINSRRTAMTLPRMSFEITSFTYDSTRKLASTLKMRKDAKSETDSSRNFVHSAVPYNLDFSLYIMTKYSEDATKIMEQIIPFFTPDWTVTAKMVEDLDAIDIPIILNSVSTEDLYENDFESRTSIVYTLSFTLKGWYFGPEKKQKVIKFVDIDLATDTDADKAPDERIIIKPGMDAQGNPLTQDSVLATAIASLNNGSLSNITVVNNGENYNEANTNVLATIAAPDSANAVITPVITNTSISSFAINESGGFYTATPSITISAPNMPITTATAAPTVTGDSISAINVTDSGTYYNSATVAIEEPPLKSAVGAKFGTDALGHSSHTDQTFSHTTTYNLVTAGNGFSIEFWIYPTEFNASDNHILSYSGQTMRLEIETGGILVYRPALNSSPVRSTPEALNLNQWNHCRITHVGTTARWTVNGVSDQGGSAPQGFLFGGGATVTIGSRSANEKSFLGSIDNITFSTTNVLPAVGAYTIPTTALTGNLHTDDFEKVPATATATVTAGEITGITVTNPGENYTGITPTVTISAPDGVAADYQASATATLTDGAISNITINNAGKFYNSATTTVPGVISQQATANVAISKSGEVSSITIIDAGLGYRVPPVVTISEPVATAVSYTQIEFDDDWGIITIFEDA